MIGRNSQCWGAPSPIACICNAVIRGGPLRIESHPRRVQRRFGSIQIEQSTATRQLITPAKLTGLFLTSTCSLGRFCYGFLALFARNGKQHLALSFNATRSALALHRNKRRPPRRRRGASRIPSLGMLREACRVCSSCSMRLLMRAQQHVSASAEHDRHVIGFLRQIRIVRLE